MSFLPLAHFFLCASRGGGGPARVQDGQNEEDEGLQRRELKGGRRNSQGAKMTFLNCVLSYGGR